MNIEELNILYLEKARYKQELIKIDERIRLVRSNIQKNCSHDNIKQHRDYDGHKWNVSNVCSYCLKEVNGKNYH